MMVKEAALKLNKRFYYGWMMVLVSGLAFFVSAPGQTYSISVFINAYNQEFGYSSTLISSGYSIATTISGLSLIFMGKAVDKFGPRTMLIIVGIMLGVTAFYNSFVSNIAMIFVGFFLLRYFGQGSMTLIPNALVPQWFEKKRAFTISLAGLGNLLATLTIPAFNLWMINALGWQQAWRVWSLILLVGFVPIAFLFVINRPEDLGMTMENEDYGDDEEAIKESLLQMERESYSLKEALRTKEFWFAGIIGMIPSMFTTGITFHFFSMMALRSVSNEQAAVIIGLVALPAFIMPFLAKIVIDRYPVKYVFTITLTMMVFSMLWLMLAVNGAITATLFILFYGVAVAVQGVALNVLWPNYFGRLYLGSIRGAATVFMVIGSALGPLPFGIGYDLTGGYNHVIFGMMIFTGITIFMALAIKKPRKMID